MVRSVVDGVAEFGVVRGALETVKYSLDIKLELFDTEGRALDVLVPAGAERAEADAEETEDPRRGGGRGDEGGLKDFVAFRRGEVKKDEETDAPEGWDAAEERHAESHAIGDGLGDAAGVGVRSHVLVAFLEVGDVALDRVFALALLLEVSFVVGRAARFAVVGVGSTVVTRSCRCEEEREGASSSLRRRLTPIGRFALLSETAENPSIEAVLIEVEGSPPLEREELAAALDVGLCGSSFRFRSRVDKSSLCFVEVPEFHTRDAIVVDDGQNERWVVEALQAPLPEDKPPWEVRVRHLSPWRTALLLRAHHCLADGVSLASLVAKTTDQAEALEKLVDAEISKHRRFLGRLAAAIGFFLQLAVVFLAACRTLFFVPRPFKRRVSRAKRRGRSLAWAAFADVPELRAVAKRLGGPRGTINDVFSAVCAGALKAEFPGDKVVGAAFPVHLYGGALPKGVEVGNALAAALCPLPLPDDDDLGAHVAAVGTNVGGTLRGGVAPLLAYALAVVLGSFAPRDALPWLMRSFAESASCAITNVKGPPLKLSLCGRDVVTVVGFLPPPPGIPVGCALVSVDGRSTISVNADASVLDADAFLANALDYYAKLKAAAVDDLVEAA
ncbi:hypothetical protein CTAYLR_003659 [Chrysophaeum taylorii]|uniref:Diacylglycerol O-acyltransferase n=1 Tax=Chrysophaeum taylorii TaxID=2483200 RepID=A0AAD7XL15_9STRA|nr:hypothetical protein CTAYLR_003659 [Chrysophaeum taylorii]